MSDTVIRVENISKLYRLGEVGTGTISHDLNRWWHKVRGKEDPYLKIGQTNDRTVKGTSDYAWALKDVSFEVKRGEVLGIIGRNGAGKSTLLKILSRVTTPTSGQIKIKGRVASLLEVGTGFNPELTGRDNIYLNGSILGMRKLEIDRKFDEIVAFSEVERYIDTPVKRYSSGMYVRLAFAVAAHLEPEILIVDEVLAVGDAEFQKKCLGKMKDVAGHGRTVLFVSHNMSAISSLCSAAVFMKNGLATRYPTSAEAISVYLDSVAIQGAESWTGPVGDEYAEAISASILRQNGSGWMTHLPLQVELQIMIKKPIYGLIIAWELYNSREQLLAYTGVDDMQPPPITTRPSGKYRFILEVPANTLASGDYVFALDFGVHKVRRIIPERMVSLSFRMENVEGIGRHYLGVWTNQFRPAWQWQLKQCETIAENL